MKGKVYLVGGGPGDPGLLTVRGYELVRQADVVLYDALVAPELLDLATRECERIYVGKRAGQHAMGQQTINQLLVRHAKLDRMVVRLKGGDPYVFGRGGEEAQACRAAGVPFEVVPGISSALAVPAYAGIPVLHRHVAGSLLVLHGRVRPHTVDEATPPPVAEAAPAAEAPEPALTDESPIPVVAPVVEEEPTPRRGGVVVRRHKRPRDSGEFRVRDGLAAEIALEDPAREDESEPLDIDWPAVCRAADTIVFLMFVGRMDEIREGLLAGGRPADEPVAVIQWGATPRQRTLVTTVDEFPAAVRDANMGAPAVMVIGEVVRLREQLDFHEQRPLFGWNIALTESAADNKALAPHLAEGGAAVTSTPALRAAPLALSAGEMQTLRAALGSATHLMFTRPDIVELFSASARESGIDIDSLYLQTRVLGVDDTTIEALQSSGIGATLAEGQPDDTGFRRKYGAEFQKSRVVVVEGEDEWGELADDLREAGAGVTEIPVRAWQPNEPMLMALRDSIEHGNVNAVMVLSLDAARTITRVWGKEAVKRLLTEPTVVAGNELVANELVKAGARVHITLDDTNPETIVEAMAEYRTAKA